jgi:two-component system chemotaxis family response regulator WspR
MTYDTISVLLVDDQAIIGEAVRRALASETDIAFHYCADAAEAVATAEKVAPAVILQDLVMPGTDGLALLSAYRANPATKDIPVIVLSSKEDPAVKSEAFAASADDYLVKVPDKIELIARIRHHAKAYINRLKLDAAYQELERISNIDGLTGLSNRRFLDDFLASEWRRAIREQSDFSILMIDIDDFKKYNDTYGHLAGDEVLKNVAKAIRHCIQRPADLAARFGGEEFAVILPATPLVGAKNIGANICQSVENLAVRGSSEGAAHITVSVGASSARPSRDDSYAALLLEADEALYEAKRSGKNRVVARG